MSRRKQTHPRAIKREVSQDDEENSIPMTKKFASESIQSDSFDSPSPLTIEERSPVIKCDSCQESFLTSEQFNQHRLYQCSFLPEETNSDESRTSSYDEYANQIETIPYGTSQTEEYPHQCSFCHKSFSNMALLLKHEQIHVELMPFRCSFCGKGFKHRRSLNRHSKLHTGERKFKCTLCESTFARSDHLKAHIRTHNNNTIHLPSIDKSSNLDFQLKPPSHSKSDTDERTSSTDNKTAKDEKKAEHCPYCPRICLGEDSLRSHIQTEHPQNLDEENKSDRISPDTYCHLCNAKFNNRENYYAHLRCTHPTFDKKLDPFPVPSVKKPVEKVDDSLLNDYALIERTFWCEKCKRSFDSMTVYLQHYSFQHCIQIIKCLQCQDVFETVELFFSHIERTHPSKTVETLKCKLCNATYKQRSDFLHHIQTVHKTSSYSCSLCPVQLNSSTELIDHFKFTHQIHHSRQPSFNTLFSCLFCSVKFNSRFDLNQHLLHEHTNESRETNGRKPSNSSSSDLICSQCDLTFASESLLIDHTHRCASLTHPSFQCTYCHALFTSRTQLDRHSRIHIASSGNNLKCNICDRLFVSIDILSEHKLSHCKATSSNLCTYCHQILNNENDYTRHLYEHNHQSQSKTKTKLFASNHEHQPLTIACIICKQSLMNEHEIDLHAKFHLGKLTNEKQSSQDLALSMMNLTCQQCHRLSSNQREFLLELSTFSLYCFDCMEKDLKSSSSAAAAAVADSLILAESDSISTCLSCPKCRNDVQFDSIKTYQQHFTSVHLSKQSVDEYHCLKCNRIVPSREHILQHSSKNSPPSGFLIDSIDSTRSTSPPRVHYCYLCRTNFDTVMKMHIHLLEHQYPNHDYQCTLCEQCSFADASQLYHHMVQHGIKARLHPCRECDVYFMFSIHLINHQYSHTDETVLSHSRSRKFVMKKKSSNEEDETSCKSMMTRSSTKGTCRSVIVS